MINSLPISEELLDEFSKILESKQFVIYKKEDEEEDDDIQAKKIFKDFEKVKKLYETFELEQQIMGNEELKRLETLSSKAAINITSQTPKY